MTHRIRAFLLAATLVAIPATALAGQTPVMTFEEFTNGATNVDGFYGLGVTWLNEEIFNSTGTPALSPFAGPNVLTRTDCATCELELLSTSAVSSITLSGVTFSLNLEIRTFNSLGQQVGSNLVVDTEVQSVGCAIITAWSCNREFDFTLNEDIRRLQFITSGSAVIDNVQLTIFEDGGVGGGGGGVVPEPSTLALLGLGLLGIAGRRRGKPTRRPGYPQS